MKKFGFTLSEVLMTLGIIGVVAALSAPALIQHVGSSRIGPSLGKARNTFEEATQMMLGERNVTRLSQVNNWINVLPEYMRATVVNRNENEDDEGINVILYTNDNMSYAIEADNIQADIIGTVIIDINGDLGKNQPAIDQFFFALSNNGILRPFGSRELDLGDAIEGSGKWNIDHNCDKEGVNAPETCAGSIFENDMRVIYKLNRIQNNNNNN